ncbi:SH3 domain-containing protein, partial [Helicobacter marmotae]
CYPQGKLFCHSEGGRSPTEESLLSTKDSLKESPANPLVCHSEGGRSPTEESLPESLESPQRFFGAEAPQNDNSSRVSGNSNSNSSPVSQAKNDKKQIAQNQPADSKAQDAQELQNQAQPKNQPQNQANPNNQNNTQARVNVRAAFVRAMPSTQAAIIAKAPLGRQMQILSLSPDKQWAEIHYIFHTQNTTREIHGYIATRLLAFED